MCQRHPINLSLSHRLLGLVFWGIQRHRSISQTGLRNCDDPSRYPYFRVVGVRSEGAFCKSRRSHQKRPRFAFYIGDDGLGNRFAAQKRSPSSCIAASGFCGAGAPASWCAGTASHSRNFNGRRLTARYSQRSLRPNFGGRGSSTPMPACNQRCKNSSLSRSGDCLVIWQGAASCVRMSFLDSITGSLRSMGQAAKRNRRNCSQHRSRLDLRSLRIRSNARLQRRRAVSMMCGPWMP